MRITRLEIENFRAITHASLDDLREMVVIAGPNGCGKSCLLDAIRLLKSSYGGYRRDEWQQWFGEFKIDVSGRGRGLNPRALLQDPEHRMRIALSVALTEEEIEYLRANAKTLLENILWEEYAPSSQDLGFASRVPLARELRQHQPEVEERASKELAEVEKDLDHDRLEAELIIHPNLDIDIKPSPALELAFSTYAPQHLGVIDYHGAHRTYGREQIGGINLNFRETRDRLSQHALYNYGGKYSNIKSEMAGSYIRSLIAKEAGIEGDSRDINLAETLSELFETFFPGKHFTGPELTPDGLFEFNVHLDSGAIHDIDELSAGEKEVLYGYLRLRTSAPRNSILLLDEPELHLNPRLVQGLSVFYEKHLGRTLGNQIWLVTHSDALLREAVEQQEFRVFHMRPATSVGANENQLSLLGPEEDVEKAVIDLVGDLAAYRPGAKVVLFEGGGGSDFDITMTRKLFPKFAEKVNPISGGNKYRVKGLFQALSQATTQAHLGAKIYCIVDSDMGEEQEAFPGAGFFKWPVYHIENFLLSPAHILAVLEDLSPRGDYPSSETEIETALHEIARGTLNGLVRDVLQQKLYNLLKQCIRTGVDPDQEMYAPSLHHAAGSTLERLSDVVAQQCSEEQLTLWETEIRGQFAEDLVTDVWKATFRGRDILRRFSRRHVQGTQYEPFRNLIISKMAMQGYRPPGMADTLEKILAD